MAAPKGNQFWKARSTHGRKADWDDPAILWEACQQYFEWVEKHPLKEEKVFHAQGLVTRTKVNKMRAMTIDGLCIFLGICDTTWTNYRTKGEDYIRVTTQADKIIRTQKFEGASADLLNANIIARDLGLSEKQEHSGPGGGPVKEDVTVTFVDRLEGKQEA